MAMNKKEQAEFEALKHQAAINRALRWTEPVEKDLPVPKSGEITQGWDFNTYNNTVSQMWSKSVVHGGGVYNEDRRSGSQNGCSLFSTELLAYRALRAAVEMKVAKQLVDIDAKIAELQERAK